MSNTADDPQPETFDVMRFDEHPWGGDVDADGCLVMDAVARILSLERERDELAARLQAVTDELQALKLDIAAENAPLTPTEREELDRTLRSLQQLSSYDRGNAEPGS